MNQRVLTSATDAVTIPDFLGIEEPISMNYLNQRRVRGWLVKTIAAEAGGRLEVLAELLGKLRQPGIIFCNFKESLFDASDFLFDHKIEHECYYGGMEQSTEACLGEV